MTSLVVWGLALVVGCADSPSQPNVESASKSAERRQAADRPPAASQHQPPADFDGVAFLQKYCHDCHGVRDEAGTGLSVLDRDFLTAARDGAKPSYLVPGKPESSLLWIKAVRSRSMPDDYAVAGQHPIPNDSERAGFESWIRAGAKFPTAATREYLSEEAVLLAVRDHLASQPASDRPFWRYLSLATLHNNRAEITDRQLQLTRAAASKLLNSLSWQPKITPPAAIGKGDFVLALDLRNYGWNQESHWRLVERANPYGVKFGEDQKLLTLQGTIQAKAKSQSPVVRADWFIATVSRAPLYDQLLELPETLQALERRLGVNWEENFLQDKLLRAGLLQSQVSRNYRLLERHATAHGAYWRSYDFASTDDRANLLRFPLGPAFDANPFRDQAFEHAGGEIVFHLPNGMIGYMLTDKSDKRLDAPAPIAIVRDLREAAGSPEIVNGLSCLACHNAGLKRFKDQVRTHPAVFDAAKRKVDRLYGTSSQLDKAVSDDERIFQAAFAAACGVFLSPDAEADCDPRNFEEPIAAVARLFQRDLTPATAAAELGFSDPRELYQLLKSNLRMRELGLAPLLEASGVKRALWERRGVSLFNFLSIELRRTPVQEF